MPSHHTDSSQVASYFNPVRGLRDEQVRRGQKPKNHARENAKLVADLSNRTSLLKMRDAERVPEARRIPKSLAEVPSSGYGAAAYSRGPTPVPELENESALYGADATSPSKESRNFIKENTKISPPPKSAAPTKSRKYEVGAPPPELPKGRSAGAIPRYLVNRKVELAEAAAERRRRAEEELIPPGMRLMGEEERLDTLRILSEQHEETHRSLQMMPFVIETPSQIKHKAHLERRLAEIEAAQKAFSRPRVYVEC